MLTKTLPLITGLLLCASANAQELRLSGGYNGSNVREAGEESWVGRAGYQFGADVLLGSTWFVRSGAHLQVRNLNFSYATTDANGQPSVSPTEFRYTGRSLRVPLHLGRYILDQDGEPGINGYAFGGPTALFNINARLDQDEFEVNTAPVQWYVGFGGGVQFSFLFIEGGYDLAMSNIFDGDYPATDPRVNQVYAVAGVRFDLAK